MKLAFLVTGKKIIIQKDFFPTYLPYFLGTITTFFLDLIHIFLYHLLLDVWVLAVLSDQRQYQGPRVVPLCETRTKKRERSHAGHLVSNFITKSGFRAWLRCCIHQGQGLSRYLVTGCPNRGFKDFCVSKVWYKIHTTNKIDPIPLQILLF